MRELTQADESGLAWGERDVHRSLARSANRGQERKAGGRSLPSGFPRRAVECAEVITLDRVLTVRPAKR